MNMIEKQTQINDRLNAFADVFGKLLVDLFHNLALFIIGASIVWSGVIVFIEMCANGGASIEDILLLFIYLELGAMVGIYFNTNRMPIRFMIYIAITALTRMLIGTIQSNHTPDMGILYVSGAILILALANLIVRYGSSKYPSFRPEIEKGK